MEDLTADPDVLAVYLGGSLAKGDYDNYSDIDLHTIVAPGKRVEFIKNKRVRAERWGNILFHEDANPLGPVVVTHYIPFIKVDSWYHAPEEIVPSIWLKGVDVLHDPKGIISNTIKESSNISYILSTQEVEVWKSKILAFAHETYRAVMREEIYHAESNLDKMRWLVVLGWYMEEERHFDASYGSWSKIEGRRSILNERQLTLLRKWKCGKVEAEIMNVLVGMTPEILRLNEVLSEKVEIKTDQEQFKSILEMSH
ncbi:nucleotidyltransferase domain-containing protein [Salinicoccus hispanicus]|nr:nucleotidyltransferase domain-containing protein [Salinicoccus hispanicus]